MKRLLIVEDKESLANMLREAVEADGFEAGRRVLGLGGDALAGGGAPLRWRCSRTCGCRARTASRYCGRRRRAIRSCPVIVMTAFGTIENAVEAMKLGAFDFIQKPIDIDHLSLLLRRCREHRELRHENLLLKEEFQKLYRLPAIVGESPRIVEVSHAIQRVAPTDATVLLLGESGTGKELFARAIHQLSPRRDRPFVAINCAAIPTTLIENELFGHEKGAFTGRDGPAAREVRAGGQRHDLPRRDRRAGSGRTVRRSCAYCRSAVSSGSAVTASIDVDVRIICATNRNLEEDVRRGAFRDDLFFRINVFPVTVPPLRTRREDVDALTDFFLQRFERELPRPGLKHHRRRTGAAARLRLAGQHPRAAERDRAGGDPLRPQHDRAARPEPPRLRRRRTRRAGSVGDPGGGVRARRATRRAHQDHGRPPRRRIAE